MPAGGRYVASAYVAVRQLRALGCRLPIEMWYLGPGELPAEHPARGPLSDMGVDFIDAHAERKRSPSRILNGWELKPYSIIHSKFREVLLLDADNLAVRDPTGLFDDSSLYRSHGAVFWPDRGQLAADRSVWEVFGIGWRPEPEFESGQILVDKVLSWDPLLLSMHYNEYSDWYYRHMYGDKDTYHMAWRVLGRDYGMVPCPVRHVDDVFHQSGEDGLPLFQHGVKWIPDVKPRPRSSYLFYSECCGYLHEFARLLNVGKK